MSKIAALLASLCLLHTTTAGGLEVRRSSLFGYTVAGEVLELQEVVARAERAEVLARRPGLVRLAPATSDGVGPLAAPPPAPAPCHDTTCHATGDDEDVFPWDTGGAGDRVVELDPAPPADLEEPAPASGPRDLADGADVDELTPTPGHAVVCAKCGGGRRYQTLGCTECRGYHVKVFLEGREVTPSEPPQTDEDRLGAVHALADLHEDLSDRQLGGAFDLCLMLLQGASPTLRTEALAHWEHVRKNEAFQKIEMERQAPGPFENRWSKLDRAIAHAPKASSKGGV